VAEKPDIIEPGADFWKQFPFDRRKLKETAAKIPIRERIFNDELKSLATAIIAHGPSQSAGGVEPELSAASLPEITPYRLNDEVYAMKPLGADYWEEAMRLLAIPQLAESDFEACLNLIHDRTGSGAVCVLTPDELEGVYRVALQKGLDSLTERTFIIGFRDNFLLEDLPVQKLAYSESLNHSFHYRKRFSSEFLHQFPLATFFHFPTLDTSCYFACFYASEQDVRIDEVWLLGLLNAIYPAILKFSHEKLNPETKSEDPTLKFSKLFKRYSHTGKDRFSVTHMTFSDASALSIDHPFLGRFQEFCTSHQTADRIVILSPAHALLLHSSGSLDAPRYLLQNLAMEWGMKIDFQTTEYPGEESNLYNLMLV